MSIFQYGLWRTCVMLDEASVQCVFSIQVLPDLLTTLSGALA